MYVCAHTPPEAYWVYGIHLNKSYQSNYYDDEDKVWAKLAVKSFFLGGGMFFSDGCNGIYQCLSLYIEGKIFMVVNHTGGMKGYFLNQYEASIARVSQGLLYKV